MAVELVRCCGRSREPVRRFVDGDGVRHLGAYCPACGRWLRWLERTPDNLAGVPEPDRFTRAEDHQRGIFGGDR